MARREPCHGADARISSSFDGVGDGPAGGAGKEFCGADGGDCRGAVGGGQQLDAGRSALVLLMSGPGLALFYGGLVRRKNVLGTMMQTFAMMAVITVLWALLTYSLAFGEGNAFIGGLHNVFLHGVGLTPDPKYAATIPLQTFMVFQPCLRSSLRL